MGSLTDSWETFVLDVLLGSDTGSTRETVLGLITPRSRYLALLQGTPSAVETQAGLGVSFAGEVSGGGYQRQHINVGAVQATPTQGAAWRVTTTNPTTYFNRDPYTFTNMPAVTVTGFALCLLLTASAFDPILWGAFATPVAVAAGATLVVPPDGLSFTID